GTGVPGTRHSPGTPHRPVGGTRRPPGRADSAARSTHAARTAHAAGAAGAIRAALSLPADGIQWSGGPGMTIDDRTAAAQAKGIDNPLMDALIGARKFFSRRA